MSSQGFLRSTSLGLQSICLGIRLICFLDYHKGRMKNNSLYVWLPEVKKTSKFEFFQKAFLRVFRDAEAEFEVDLIRKAGRESDRDRKSGS